MPGEGWGDPCELCPKDDEGKNNDVSTFASLFECLQSQFDTVYEYVEGDISAPCISFNGSVST
jgi:hypothetical protein